MWLGVGCVFATPFYDDTSLDVNYLIILQIVAELPAGTNWNFDVHWYPKIPGVISASSFDGKIGIYNVEVCFVTR